MALIGIQGWKRSFVWSRPSAFVYQKLLRLTLGSIFRHLYHSSPLTLRLMLFPFPKLKWILVPVLNAEHVGLL